MPPALVLVPGLLPGETHRATHHPLPTLQHTINERQERRKRNVAELHYSKYESKSEVSALTDVVSPLCLMCWQPAGDSGRYTGRCGARSPVSTKYRIMYELATSDGIGCRVVNRKESVKKVWLPNILKVPHQVRSLRPTV